LGYGQEELLTLSPLDTDAPEQQGQIKQVAHRVADDSFALFETVVRRKDGRSLPVEIHASRIRVNGETLVISLVRDISARQQAEAERAALVSELTRKNRSCHTRELPFGYIFLVHLLAEAQGTKSCRIALLAGFLVVITTTPLAAREP
jgi:hypothetical protein